MIESVIQVCQDIMDGKADNQIFDAGPNVVIAKKVDSDNNRIDGGIGNIVYDRNKIFN